jgi:hypothetical protein
MSSCIPPLRFTDSEHIMGFSPASNGRAPSHPPSHFQSSLDPQQPWSFNRPDTRFDAHRRSMTLPNSDSELAYHPQVSQAPTSPRHPPFTGGSNRSHDFSVYGATPSYLPDGPHDVSAMETTALRQPSHPPSELAYHPQVSQAPTSPRHPPFTGGSNRSHDFSVYGATPSYLPDGPHAISAMETTASSASTLLSALPHPSDDSTCWPVQLWWRTANSPFVE